MASAAMFADELSSAYDVPVSHCRFITKYVDGVKKVFPIEICYSTSCKSSPAYIPPRAPSGGRK
ncbi:hypothetical protein BDQ17DRAFT_1422477 [Cyathus striatus]|nr:hypothetical protein BDQ17DRAFT_1422477 [Cyathus striatus]